MTNATTLFGLDLTKLSALGIDGNTAVSFFGQTAVANLVNSVFNFGESVVTSGNTANLFNQAAAYDAALNMQDNAGAVAALSDVDATLRGSIGKGLTDISYTIGSDGTVTAGIDGIAGATNSVNIGDLLAQATAGIDLPDVSGLPVDLFSF